MLNYLSFSCEKFNRLSSCIAIEALQACGSGWLEWTELIVPPWHVQHRKVAPGGSSSQSIITELPILEPPIILKSIFYTAAASSDFFSLEQIQFQN